MFGILFSRACACVSPPRTAACSNAWLSCRLAPYSKHRAPPTPLRVALCWVLRVWHRGEGIGGNQDFPRFPRSLPRAASTRPRTARPGGARGRSFSGALRTGGSAQPEAEEPRVGGRCRVGEGRRGGSCLNFDPAAARGKPPPPRPSWVPRRSPLRRAFPRLPL